MRRIIYDPNNEELDDLLWDTHSMKSITLLCPSCGEPLRAVLNEHDAVAARQPPGVYCTKVGCGYQTVFNVG